MESNKNNQIIAAGISARSNRIERHNNNLIRHELQKKTGYIIRQFNNPSP